MSDFLPDAHKKKLDEYGFKDDAAKSWLSTAWRRFRRHRLALVGAVVIIVLYSVAVLAPWIAPYDPVSDIFVARRLEGPSLQHPFGLDEVGRDLLSRVIWGSRISLAVGFVAAGVSLVLGVVLGALAGYFGGFIDSLIMRMVDLLMAIPQFLLIIAIVAAVGPNFLNIILVIGATGWAHYARVTRGEFLSLRNEEFVEAAKAAGASTSRIIFYHILPNSMAPIIVLATLNVAGAVLLETALSFLGFGVQPPTASWGSILAPGRQYLRRAAHIATFPGLAITMTVLAFNLAGDGLRDALDPKMQL
ncbi:MAG: ABC transporter permease [Bacillota bacterium]|jgi:peptide/nickel transport system permease protein